MNDRERPRELLVCVVLAVFLHMVAAWAMGVWSGSGSGVSERLEREPTVDRELPRREAELGRPESRTASMAWISHEDYRELIAPRASTEQPAVQQEVDPVEEAPVELEPTPPAPTPSELASVAEAEAMPDLDEPPLAMQREADPLPLELPELETAEPMPPPTFEREAVAAAERDRLPMTSTQVERSDTAAPESADARPTAAPRDDAEADPTRIESDELTYRAGGVIVGPGVSVRPVRPRLSIMSRYTAVPRDVTVEITFNSEGRVDAARLVGSTGYSDVDGAILTSLYRWRAEGERIEQADPRVTIEIDYKFGHGP